MIRHLKSVRVPLRAVRQYSDTMFVNPKDPNVDTKDFFKFQTGRWLVNDKQEREARTTKFDLNGLLEVLKEHVDYLQKTPEQSDLRIETIEPYFEGKHNKLYKLVLNDRRIYMLRIPYAIGHQEYREKRLLSEVATMDFLKTKHGMKIPTPVAWSGTTNNPLQSQYILMDFVAGEKLMKYWKPWSEDMTEKSAIIKPAVDFIDQMLTTEFTKFGSLYFTEDVSADLQKDLPYKGETDKELVDRWRIGQTTEKRFWKGRTVDIGAQYRGPWNSWQDYIRDTAAVQMAYIDDAIAQDPSSELLKNAKDTAERYSTLVPSLFEQGEYPPEVYSPRLHNPDVSPLNILEQDELTKFWLIDFENTAVRPMMLHGVPWFVRNPGERIYKKEEVDVYDSLPAHEKAIVDHYIRLTQIEFTYEFLFHKVKPTLFQALNPSVKRRQEVVQRDLDVNIASGFHNDLDYAIFKLAQTWQYLNLQPPRDFPVDLSDAVLAKIGKDVNAWNAKIAADPLIESGGYVSATEFDKLLGEGKIEPEGNGNYKYVEAPAAAA